MGVEMIAERKGSAPLSLVNVEFLDGYNATTWILTLRQKFWMLV